MTGSTVNRTGGIVVLSAPSGAGKTTIAHRVLEAIPGLRFSVSATTRAPRPNEVDGVDYHFLTEQAFRELLETGELLEYEEVYPGRFYGTLKSEVARATVENPVLLDLDVKGGVSVKRVFGDAALTVFIQPPSIEALEARLRGRATETEEVIRIRLDRARLELEYAPQFDHVVVNDDLEKAVAETLQIVRSFLKV